MKNIGFSLIAVAIVVFSCTHRTVDKSPINDNVVLQVADVRITAYELEKNLKRFKEAYQDTASMEPGENDVEKWIQEFINRAYFLADAYERGYHEQAEVARGVASMEKLMIAQRRGILEQFLIDKMQPLDQKEIDLARERNRKKISIAYLKFKDFNTATHFIGGNQLKGLAEFDEAIGRSIGHQNVIHGEAVIEWPFVDFWEYGEYLFSMKKGELTPILMFQHGAYLFYIKDTAIADEPAPTDEIIQKLNFQQEVEIVADYQNEVNGNTHIIYNPDALSKFNKILSKLVPLHEFEKQHFHEILSENAFTFIVEEKQAQHSIADFIDYYNYLPFKQEIRSTEQIGHIIRSWVYSEYSYAKAEKLGITNDPEFILDRENYRKNLIYSYYETEELKKSIKLYDEAIADWYGTNKSRYVKPDGVNVSIFSFDNLQNAGKGIVDIMQNRRDTARLTSLKGLRDIQWNTNMGYGQPFFPPKVMQRLLFMENDQVLPPHELGDNYSVIVKNYDYGQQATPLHEVRAEIIREMEAFKLLEIKRGKLPGLKAKYSCINKITPEKYRQYL
ncbi:hypothetical protein [Parapedobacter tibetensis]|uniref:hypothetical protein n=1 Tax=Parapedobacter tibetensis TaxID=2972951 RepID=UPI00214D4119|nr:hypothetical protein [Parapedobacter tibetensis]